MVRQSSVLKGAGVVLLLLFALIGGVWIAFVPSAKEPSYQLDLSWGERGTGPGQFHDPTGIAVAGGEVFVADARNARIQVFDHDGRFLRQFGERGETPGRLGRPMNLTVAMNELYVADYWTDRIEVFDVGGAHKRTIGRPGSGQGEFNAPGGVAVAENGDLYVADFYNQRITHLRPDGSFVRQWGTTGEVGIGAGEFNYPTDVDLAPDGTFHVADGYNDRIQSFAADGSFLGKWGGPLAMNVYGPFNGWFATVTSIAVGPDGNVFAADFYNSRIQKFTPGGKFLTAFGAAGDGPGKINFAMAVDVADDGTVFVADFGNNRIQKWRPENMVEWSE